DSDSVDQNSQVLYLQMSKYKCPNLYGCLSSLLAFLWTCGRQDTSSKPTIESVPPSIAEGGNALLLVHNPPENIEAFIWFKQTSAFTKTEIAQYIIDRKSTVWGPAYSGRETLYSDGSLLLHGVTQKDPGLYILQILRTDMRREQTQVQLQVHSSLSPCCVLTSSQVMIQAVPQYAAVGERVHFQVHNLPKDVNAFSWYKLAYGGQEIITKKTLLGPAHSGREIVYFNGTLVLQNTTQKDAGFYTLLTLNAQFETQETHVYLHIYKPVIQPFIRVTSTTVTAQSSVVFTCLPGGTGVSIRWIFNNRSLQLTERMTLSPTKCQLSIDPVRIEDAGDYQCEVFNPGSSKTSLPVSLVVRNA
uniref:Ig-like domain-containing protein n=1 Tax=Cricetulus griseus TaxID=10029 RepID=A0A8C2ME77_CRIGR